MADPDSYYPDTNAKKNRIRIRPYSLDNYLKIDIFLYFILYISMKIPILGYFESGSGSDQKFPDPDPQPW